jgi:hypothetical protein
MTFVLLAGALLFLRSRDALLSGNPGFETSHVLYLPIDGIENRALLESRVLSIPGVQGVAFGSPFNSDEAGVARQEIRSSAQENRGSAIAGMSLVSSGYFDVLGIPIRRGRAFTPNEAELGSAVVVVSERLAATMFSGTEPLGQRVRLPDDTSAEVIGIVSDVSSERFAQTDGPHLYRPASKNAGGPMLIRFAGDGRELAAAASRAVAEVSPGAIVVPKTLNAILQEAADRMKTIIRLTSGLAGIALALAAAGFYGVVDFGMSRRTKELGIRTALGATRGVIVRAALLSGARPVVAGLVIGLFFAAVGAQALTRILSHTPVALHPSDGTVYVVSAALVATIAAMAMIRPIWRAAGCDPVRALREE